MSLALLAAAKEREPENHAMLLAKMSEETGIPVEAIGDNQFFAWLMSKAPAAIELFIKYAPFFLSLLTPKVDPAPEPTIS
jgi:hypothetical protein